jgi:hypothetical protein
LGGRREKLTELKRKGMMERRRVYKFTVTLAR